MSKLSNRDLIRTRLGSQWLAPSPQVLASVPSEASQQTLGTEIETYKQRRLTLSDYPGAEKDDYDFTAERRKYRKTNLVESMAHLVKTSLGAGLFTIHVGFKYGGIWTSFGFSFVIGYFVLHNYLLLVRSTHIMYGRLRITKLTFPDLGETVLTTGPLECPRRLGRYFRYLLELLLLAVLSSTCNIYQMMMGSMLKEVVQYFANDDIIYNWSARVYIAIVTIPIMLICCIRSMKLLSLFSLIADVFLIISVLVMLICYELPYLGNIADRPAWKDAAGFFRFCGIFLFSIDAIPLVLPIENNMAKPSQFSRVAYAAMSIVFVLVTLVGFFGYLAFGEESVTPVTVHLPRNTGPMVAQLALILILMVSFAVDFWVSFRIVWRYVGRKIKKKRAWWETLCRCVQVLIITAVSLIFPSVYSLMSLIGNIILSFTVLIIPSLIETLLMWNVPYRRMKNTLNFASIGLGLLLFCGGIYESTQTDFNAP